MVTYSRNIWRNKNRNKASHSRIKITNVKKKMFTKILNNVIRLKIIMIQGQHAFRKGCPQTFKCQCLQSRWKYRHSEISAYPTTYFEQHWNYAEIFQLSYIVHNSVFPHSSMVISKSNLVLFSHDDVIKWKHFPRYWPFVRGIHRSPVNSPHKGQWRGALLFSLICAWINGWVNNGEADDLRRHCAHCDVIVMKKIFLEELGVCFHDIPH